MPKTPFVWKAELGGAPDSAFSAQLGSVTYNAVTRSYGHPAYIEVRLLSADFVAKVFLHS